MKRHQRVQNIIRDVCFLILGCLGAALGVKGFLVPNGLIDGGVTGISMLLALVSGSPLGVIIGVCNLPFLVLAYLQLGARFAITGAISIAAFALSLHFLPITPITSDLLLSAIFGGALLGGGIGLAIRGGGVLDGSEIFALVVSRRSTLRVGDVILLVNAVIFTAGGFAIGLESTLYSLLTYFSATRTVDFLLYGIEEFNGVLIVSKASSAIREFLLQDLKRGVTIIPAKGGYDHGERDVLFCVLTRLELPRARSGIAEIDEEAFVVNFTINNAVGGVTARRLKV